MGFRAGDRIRMVHCADPYAPIRPGEKGVIDHIDDVGTLHMAWDSGRTLGVCLNEDSVQKIPLEKEFKNFDSVNVSECLDEPSFDKHQEKAIFAISQMDTAILDSGGAWVVRRTYLDPAHKAQLPEYVFVEAGELGRLLDGTDVKNGVDVGFHEAGRFRSFVMIAHGAEYATQDEKAHVKEAFECKALTKQVVHDYRERMDAGWSDRGDAPRSMFFSPRDQQSIVQPMADCQRAFSEHDKGMPKDMQR